MADKRENSALLLKNFKDRETDSFAILQLPIESNEKYRPLDDVVRAGKPPVIDNYHAVYVGALTERSKSQSVTEVLEELYAQFNFNRPADYTAHRLSVSDIILLRQDGVVKSYYCDYIGFAEVPQFFDPVKPEPTSTRNYSDCPSRAFIAIIGYDEEDEEYGDEGPGDHLENEFSYIQEMGDSRLSLCDWALTDDDDQWEQYIRYLALWAIDHSDPEYQGMSPASYEEWLENECQEG